jgi:divalent metal cation (Fe/Co/Zn/Cd) transporter
VSLFEIVLLAAVGIGVVVAAVVLTTTGRTWTDYGRSHLLMDKDQDASPKASGTVAAQREREQEIRELLTARNELRRRRGEATADVERELRRLTAPKIDPELRDEIRQLVIARNHRRQRSGKPPLDVEAEVERKIAELSE